jgi:cytochrome c peroxidase
MKQLSLLVVATVILASCNMNPNNQTKKKAAAFSTEEEQKLLAQAQGVFKPLEANSAYSESNPHSEAKVKLGKMLYFDTRLSKDGNNSCNSCHKIESFGVDNLPTSPGDLGKNGNRNSPTTFNAALHTAQFWDGRAAHVEEQAGMPILNPAEMNIPSKEFLEKRLSEIEAYKKLFAEAFPESKQPLSYDNLQNAIGSFERTLVTPARFDEYLKGKSDALTYEEKQGLQLFMDNGCATCHNGVALGGNSFQKFGAVENYRNYTGSKTNDEGKKEVTKNEADKDIFKVPSLRNITKTYPYFHDGSVEELNRAITIMGKIQLDKDLNKEQVNKIIAFLETLTSDVPDEVKRKPQELAEL